VDLHARGRRDLGAEGVGLLLDVGPQGGLDKEVWTFVVWVVYAAYMHARATAGWEPRKAMWIAIAGFVTVVLNFAVVNVYFVGQHSYSGL